MRLQKRESSVREKEGATGLSSASRMDLNAGPGEGPQTSGSRIAATAVARAGVTLGECVIVIILGSLMIPSWERQMLRRSITAEEEIQELGHSGRLGILKLEPPKP